MPSEHVGRAVQARIYRAGVFGRHPSVPVNAAELERAAKRAMSKRAWSYVHGSAGTESTALANRRAFDGWRIAPRMLVDVSGRDMSIELFGRRHPTPFLLAPIGVLEMASPECDLAVARAAAALDVPMMISTQASTSTEEIVAEMGEASRWYQLYWSNHPELAASMVRRAEAAGCSALVLTVDTHTLGWRTRDLDLGFLPFARGLGIAQYTSDPVFQQLVNERLARPPSARPSPTPEAVRSLVTLARRYPGSTRDNLRSPVPLAAVETFFEAFSNPALTWADLPFLREHTSLPILLKGLQRPDDARRALDAGMDGIVVSNHGGRQVDGALASLDALPGIVDAVDGAVPIVFDSGVRCGADAFKALALGASAIAIGRPYVYGLALAGEQGVREVLEHLMAELDLIMSLTGITSVAEITRDLLAAT